MSRYGSLAQDVKLAQVATVGAVIASNSGNPHPEGVRNKFDGLYQGFMVQRSQSVFVSNCALAVAMHQDGENEQHQTTRTSRLH